MYNSVMDTTFTKIYNLLTLPDGWNGYDGSAPQSNAVEYAHHWISLLHTRVIYPGSLTYNITSAFALVLVVSVAVLLFVFFAMLLLVFVVMRLAMSVAMRLAVFAAVLLVVSAVVVSVVINKRDASCLCGGTIRVRDSNNSRWILILPGDSKDTRVVF